MQSAINQHGDAESNALSHEIAMDGLIHEGYTLEQVIVLSRHNIRSPMIGADSIVANATPHTWFAWTSPAAQLSLRGGVLETCMGQYFREWLEGEGLFPKSYRPKEGAVRIYANSRQRTISTAKFFSAGLLPTANVDVEYHMEFDSMDPVFNPVLTFMSDDYRQAAKQQVEELFFDDINRLSDNYRLLEDVIDMKDSKAWKDGTITEFRTDDTQLLLEKDKEPALRGSLKTACSICDALVLQSYEESDTTKAAFGKSLGEEEWDAIAEIKDVYVDTLYSAPLVACNVAHPLLKELLGEMEQVGRRFTFLCGHDSNIASVLAALDAHMYELPSAIEERTPIGSKLVFCRWSNDDGEMFWDADIVYQTPEQLRDVAILSEGTPPAIFDVAFRGIEQNADGLFVEDDLKARFVGAIGEYERLATMY